MADIAAYAALFTVVAMLLLSVWRQFNILGWRGQILDSIGILPQWKFFAQTVVAMSDDILDDYHLLIRLADRRGQAGPWEEIVWNDDHKWLEMIWNPDLRPRGEIQMRMLLASRNTVSAHEPHYQTSLTYLTLLRHCLDCIELAPGQAIQFVIVATAGREFRSLAVRFVSAWHIS